jgi:hypothetical protein
LHLLKHPRRPHRSGEWTPATAVTFIVTLAARQSVTLAARCAGMSRKSAYALKARDPAFAAAWTAAIAAGNRPRPLGNKVSDTHALPIPPPLGNRSRPRHSLTEDLFARDRFFAELLNRRRDSGPLAGTAAAQ